MALRTPVSDEERKQRTERRKKFLGSVDTTEQAKLTKFMGTGPLEANARLNKLTGKKEDLKDVDLGFRRTTLEAFRRYASELAGTPEDFPQKVWSVRKKLLDKAHDMKLGK